MPLPADFHDPFAQLQELVDKAHAVAATSPNTARVYLIPELAQALIDERNALLADVERLAELLTKGHK